MFLLLGSFIMSKMVNMDAEMTKYIVEEMLETTVPRIHFPM